MKKTVDGPNGLPNSKASGRVKLRQRVNSRHKLRLELPPAVGGFLTEPATAANCLNLAEELANAIDRNMAAIHVGVDPATVVASAEEVDLQFYRELREGPAKERFAQIRSAFVRWQEAYPERQRVLWRDCPGNIGESMRRECENFDLIALCHPGNLDSRDALHFALFRGGKLVAVAPAIRGDSRILDHVLIGWKPHANAYTTVTTAKPWLQKARKVTVLCVNDHDDQSYRTTAQELLSSLAVQSDIKSVTVGDISVGESILRYASEWNASCLMIGAYHHGPLLELVLGRVTHHVLSHATIPLLMKH